MKKILTVSLFAMMAVSAANADIASTKYVTDRTGDTSTIASIENKTYTDLTSAVNALNASITNVSGGQGQKLSDLQQSISNLEDSLGSAAYTESSAYATATQGTKADSAVQTVATGSANGTIAVDGEDVAVKGLGSAAYTASDAYDVAGSAAAAQTAAANALAAAKSELEGKITAASTSAGTNLTNKLKDYSTTAEMNTAITNNAVNTVASGTANGTIAVDGKDVAVKGLGSAAYTESGAYATAAQGTKADSAVQTVATGSANGTIAVDGEDVAVKGLGSAAYTASTAYDAAGSAAAAQTAAEKTASDALAAAKSELEGKITAASTSAGTNLTNKLKDYSTTAEMNTAITNNAVNTVASGTANGTIAVDGKDVAVKGLGSAAYTESSAYATATQGTKADNAVARTQIGAADNDVMDDVNTNVRQVVLYVLG